MTTSFCFKSTELKIIDGEDLETNPRRYGKSIALWLEGVLRENGFKATVHPDDWGWRVDCTYKPCPVWIGCGNMEDVDENGEYIIPTNENITWQCFVEADVPFIKKIFKNINPENTVKEISGILSAAINNTAHITLVNEP